MQYSQASPANRLADGLVVGDEGLQAGLSEGGGQRFEYRDLGADDAGGVGGLDEAAHQIDGLLRLDGCGVAAIDEHKRSGAVPADVISAEIVAGNDVIFCPLTCDTN